MRKILILMITALSLIACEKKNTADAEIIAVEEKQPSDYTNKIGIAKFIAHPALDAFESGVLDELKEQGYTNLEIDFQNANGEISTASSISSKFRSENVDVVVAIATPVAQSVANSIKDIPIVFGAITDPIEVGLRSVNGVQEGTNVTGVSDMTPVKEQLTLIKQLMPTASKIGFVYNSGEANSLILLKMTQKACDELGLELVSTAVTNTAEVKQATDVIAQKVDAIYFSTDNVVHAALGSLISAAAKYGVPVVMAAPEPNKDVRVVASYGVDYYTAGRFGGKMVIDILNGENPGNIPVKYMLNDEELTLYINKEVADEFGITVPEELLIKAKKVL